VEYTSMITTIIGYCLTVILIVSANALLCDTRGSILVDSVLIGKNCDYTRDTRESRRIRSNESCNSTIYGWYIKSLSDGYKEIYIAVF